MGLEGVEGTVLEGRGRRAGGFTVTPVGGAGAVNLRPRSDKGNRATRRRNHPVPLQDIITQSRQSAAANGLELGEEAIRVGCGLCRVSCVESAV